jgi:predicted dehydrogenase
VTGATRKIKFGVIGCGGAAIPVCAALQASEAAELAAACDLDERLARDIGERYRVPWTGASEGLWANPDIEAVYIAVPHSELARLARQALEAGKHALVEKPMALTLAEAESLTALAAGRGRALGVFYELRYAPSFVFARELVRGGAIGPVIGVRIQTLIDKRLEYWQAGYTGRSANPWRGQQAKAGGGVVLMNSSHQLDAVWHVTGLEVTSVSAAMGALVARVEVEDTAAAALRFENGAIGSLFAAAHVPGAAEAERCDIYGAEGQILLADPYEPGVTRFYLRRAWGGFAPAQWHAAATGNADCHRAALDDFARAAQQGTPAPIGGADARRTLATVLAVYQSAAEGRAVSVSG